MSDQAVLHVAAVAYAACLARAIMTKDSIWVVVALEVILLLTLFSVFRSYLA